MGWDLSALQPVGTIGLPAVVFIFTLRYVLTVQAVVSARFDHVIKTLRDDVERLERELSAERQARSADNEECDRKIRVLRDALRRITPPHGTDVQSGYPGDATGPPG